MTTYSISSNFLKKISSGMFSSFQYSNSLKLGPETRDSGTLGPVTLEPETLGPWDQRHWDLAPLDLGPWNPGLGTCDLGTWDPDTWHPWTWDPGTLDLGLGTWDPNTWGPGNGTLGLWDQQLTPTTDYINFICEANFVYKKLRHVCRKRRGLNTKTKFSDIFFSFLCQK